MTISGIRTSAQRIMTDPYGTRSGPMILSTLGISTNAGSSSGYNASRLRGYLEIDEKKLDEALKGNFLAVKDLFGYDSDGDLIVDSGVAYMLDTLTKSYVETGGILAVKNTTLDGQVSRIQKEIATLDVQLARKEADLKRKYGMMEGALGQMESTSSAWDNFNKQGSGQ